MRGFFAPFLLLAGSALAIDRRYSLNIANGEVAPDGFPRPAITVNGRTPGQVIYAEKGDTLYVTVRNRLTDRNTRRSTSIHWHGLQAPGEAFDDGPSFVTQCPIAPSNQYTYRLSLNNQAGTFWYHSHLSTQYIDGLRGALIIYDPMDPHRNLYDIDDPTTVIQLTDWYHDYSGKLLADWKAGLTPEPVPDSNLLNGRGRYPLGPKVPRSVIDVVRGRRYRFRILNMSAMIPFRFAIERHRLTVIEADGVNHRPVTVSSLTISPGQRYSVVVNANQPVANYWVAYPSNLLGLTVTSANLNYNGTEAFAILRYRGAPNRDPTTRQPAVQDDRAEGGNQMLREDRLKPLVNPAAAGGARPDIVVRLNFTTSRPGFSALPGVGNQWFVNGVEYIPPTVPTLLQILSGQAVPPGSAITLPRNQNVEVQFIGSRGHPFHMHGHTFSVIRSAFGNRNIVDPPRRDTAVTNDDPAAPLTIRFRTDNPGPWFVHCHKDWHLEAGLAVVFVEDAAAIRQTVHPTAAWRRLCPAYNALPADMQ